VGSFDLSLLTGEATLLGIVWRESLTLIVDGC